MNCDWIILIRIANYSIFKNCLVSDMMPEMLIKSIETIQSIDKHDLSFVREFGVNMDVTIQVIANQAKYKYLTNIIWCLKIIFSYCLQICLLISFKDLKSWLDSECQNHMISIGPVNALNIKSRPFRVIRRNKKQNVLGKNSSLWH